MRLTTWRHTVARYVLLKDMLVNMSDYAPPAWCKLALSGAIHTGKVSLYAGTGSIRAFLPPYHLREVGSTFPQRIRERESTEELITRFDLEGEPRPNSEEIEIWSDEWEEMPRRLAVGWIIFHEPWDWNEPELAYDAFEVPNDLEGLFAHDDIYEDNADTSVYHEARFQQLALSVDDADSIAPMGQRTLFPGGKLDDRRALA
jgi:hypothetical protein